MPESTSTNTQTSPMPAKIRPPRRISPFWILPIVAVVIGCLLFFQILKEQGEMISITFQDGTGITAGKTAIRYQGLQIGQVKKVSFAKGMKEVEVTAEINPEAKSILREDTKFWLVTPSASIAGVSGLDALVSGNYITLLPGEGDKTDVFVAEVEAPSVPTNEGDLLVQLLADDLGSISIGASVYFRKMPVGTISEYRFTPDQKKVEIDVIINKKFANLVKQDSRFWNISGINANIGLEGVNISADSLMSVVQGAVAFDSPNDSTSAQQGQKFQLYHNLKAAKRGTEVKVSLPNTGSLKANQAGVYYQDVQIGVLSQLEKPKDEDQNTTTQNTIQGTLLIDPNHTELLNTGSVILLKEPKFSFNKEQLTKIGELLRGSYLEIIKGEGEPSREFSVQRESDYLLSRPDILGITLVAPQSYSVEKGQGIFYNDVQIGEILERKLSPENVTFKAMIYPPYRNLIAANSKFVAASNLDVQFGLDGMRVQAGAPSDWLLGGVRVLAGKREGEAQAQYPLYKDVDSAEQGITSENKTATLTLSAKAMNGIEKGSVVLYRQFQIGEVLAVEPKKDGFDVSLYVVPKYRHLLTDHSRFWIDPAVSVKVSPQGVNVQATPILRALKGSISFDNNGVKGDRTLYASPENAMGGNSYLTLIAQDASKLSEGMAIKFRGLTIGTVEKLAWQNDSKQIKATASIKSEYYALVAKSGSVFKAISPEISTAGVKNLDAALQNYISVSAGAGKFQSQFTLADTSTAEVQYAGGFPVILETTDANGISPDAPVFYRGMQVGVVQRLSLSELGDRVFVHLRLENKHRHLVRKNSQFWEASGYTMDISLNGASMSSGTMSQLLNGGIAFSTPSGTLVQPQAEANRHFKLQRKIPEGARSWDQGVAQ